MDKETDMLDRIKKLLRLGASPNPHEAALAMAKAMELAEMNGLDISQINASEHERRIKHDYHEVPRRLAQEYKMAINVAQKFFRVRVIVGLTSLIIIGESARIAVAGYVIDFMVREARRHTTGKYARGRPRKIFIIGFFAGIHENLEEYVKKSGIDRCDQDAALDKYRDQHFLTVNRKATPVSIGKSKSAFMCGFMNGSNTRVMPACKDAVAGIRGALHI